MDHDLLCLPLPYDCLPVLLSASTSMGSECSRKPVSLGLASRILKPNFASTYVTISRRASSKVRRQLEFRIRCFSSSSGTNASSQLDLVVHLALQLLLVARHIGLPAFNSRLEFQKRAASRRNDRAKKVSLPSSGGKIISFLQPPPCLQWVLPRVGNNVIRLVTRERHKGCMHLLQHKLQVLYSSLLVRRRRQKFTVDEFCRDFRRLFSSPLQHHLGLDHSSEECLRLLRPLLGILFLAREFLRTTKAIHINETRSVFPNLGYCQIADCPHCFCHQEANFPVHQTRS